MISTEVIVALIGTAGVVATALINRRTRKKDHAQFQRELKMQSAAMDFSAFLSEWDGVHNDLKNLMDNTGIDRFIILRAWNGNLAPKWTTAVFQMRQGKQEPISYVHVDLDADYVTRLQTAIQRGSMVFSIAESDPCLIKDLYLAEGVKSSAWYHLESLDVDRVSKALVYCSFSSSSLETLPPETVAHCQRIAFRLKGIAAIFQENSVDSIRGIKI